MPPVVFREVSLNVKVVLQKGNLNRALIDRPLSLFPEGFLNEIQVCDRSVR